MRLRVRSSTLSIASLYTGSSLRESVCVFVGLHLEDHSLLHASLCKPSIHDGGRVTSVVALKIAWSQSQLPNQFSLRSMCLKLNTISLSLCCTFHVSILPITPVFPAVSPHPSCYIVPFHPLFLLVPLFVPHPVVPELTKAGKKNINNDM